MKKKNSLGKVLKRYNKIRYIGLIEGLLVGICSGFVVIAFRLALEKVKFFPGYMTNLCKQDSFYMAERF